MCVGLGSRIRQKSLKFHVVHADFVSTHLFWNSSGEQKVSKNAKYVRLNFVEMCQIGLKDLQDVSSWWENCFHFKDLERHILNKSEQVSHSQVNSGTFHRVLPTSTAMEKSQDLYCTFKENTSILFKILLLGIDPSTESTALFWSISEWMEESALHSTRLFSSYHFVI